MLIFKWCKKCGYLSKPNFTLVDDQWFYICENCGSQMAIIRLISCPKCKFEFKVLYDLETIYPPKSCPYCKEKIRKNRWVIHEAKFQ